jgi:hypothetical protein
VVTAGAGVLVLSPSRVSYRGESATSSLPLTLANPVRPWPRDLRGQVRVQGASFQVYLPGVACSGATEPSLTLECHSSDEPWPLNRGAQGVLLANLTAGRNYFDGRVTLANGSRKALAPFFSAAYAEADGRAYWLMSMLDGRTQVFDAALEPVGSVGGWGSDLAGTEAHCGGGWQILATQAGDGSEPDAIRAYEMVNRMPVALPGTLEMPGPVTALWGLGGNGAMAVVRDLVTGRYQAYAITVRCGG